MVKILLLYIEENEMVRDAMENFLSKRFDLVSSGCEDEAIRLFEELSHGFDVVIVDFMMEHGIRLLKKIESIKPGQRIITLSGSPVCSSEDGCEYCENNLNRKRIMKPVDLRQLFEAITDFENAPCQLRGECDTPDRFVYRELF